MPNVSKTIPKPNAHSNKYTRGHLAVLGGPLTSTGAARLAAMAGLRTGAGLVTILCDKKSLTVYARFLLSVMTHVIRSNENISKLISQRKVSALVLGPGAGITAHTRRMVLAALKSNLPVVLDADALSVFKPDPQKLFQAIKAECILTPHDGEFARLFPDISLSNRKKAALKSAQRSHSVVILKGSSSIVAAPDGRIKIMPKASAYLSTAGSGDVLAGICGGLLAQGMDAYAAAIMAVTIHSYCGKILGAGLIAEDLAQNIPRALRKIS